jgi:taurine dioxygenase
VPEAGGDTMFLNLYASYEALSDSMKSLVDGLIAVHDIVASMPRDFMQQSWAPKQLANLQKVTPPVEHPVVRTHPETKRKCLFVNRNFTSHIKDMTPPESDAVLSFLLEHIEQPEFQCRFHWENKSLAFWDNRCTQHYAVSDYRSKRRMHRVTICGERPH